MLGKSTQTEQIRWPISVPSSDRDRRRRPRLGLALPVVLFREGDPAGVGAVTENITAESFYCISERRFLSNERLDCEIVMPGDQMSSVPEDDLCLRCRVRVVRTVPLKNQAGFGVACVLESYSVSRAAQIHRA